MVELQAEAADDVIVQGTQVIAVAPLHTLAVAPVELVVHFLGAVVAIAGAIFLVLLVSRAGRGGRSDYDESGIFDIGWLVGPRLSRAHRFVSRFLLGLAAIILGTAVALAH